MVNPVPNLDLPSRPFASLRVTQLFYDDTCISRPGISRWFAGGAGLRVPSINWGSISESSSSVHMPFLKMVLEGRGWLRRATVPP